MDQLEDVDISDNGSFKYILIRVRDDAGSEKNIVRGYSHATWHADIFDEVLFSVLHHFRTSILVFFFLRT